MTQVHGDGVVVVAEGVVANGLPAVGDALVSIDATNCLVVLTADCVSLALASPEGVHAAVHVGWRGLLAGVVQQAVGAMRGLGAASVVGGMGPSIRPCCYEFGAPELDQLAARYGQSLRAETTDWRRSLDLGAGVGRALAEVGASLVFDDGRCTACGDEWFSHRRAGDEARQALFVWREPDQVRSR